MKTIGIDLRTLQSDSQYRGIGEVTKQITTNLLKLIEEQEKTADYAFNFYVDAYQKNEDPKRYLDIPESISWKEYIVNEEQFEKSFSSKIKKYITSQKIANSEKSDVFLQFDFKYGVPTDTKTVLVEYDLIPLLFWDRYYPTFISKKTNALVKFFMNNFVFSSFFKKVYKHKRRRVLLEAKKIISISETTKNDIIQHLKIKSEKIRSIYLGIGENTDVLSKKAENEKLPKKPYLFFVGGTDGRREIDRLVTAFEKLREAGHDIQLVLAGSHFRSIDTIEEDKIKNAIQTSQHKKDILLLGFVSNGFKKELFENSIAFIFPSLYEGFGLPVLEALYNSASVIAYDNSAIKEIGKDFIYYTSSKTMLQDISDFITTSQEKKIRLEQEKYIAKFRWKLTTQQYLKEIEKL
ncbi:MAG: glycosyltransferase family 4 protein [Streptococcaceae bacterium]|jgi:glycosyltransferase involved in cell wall biosynthesis|nr:glycosyltransferase family 4 protein [Streptococcaceae bacterium]